MTKTQVVYKNNLSEKEIEIIYLDHQKNKKSLKLDGFKKKKNIKDDLL